MTKVVKREFSSQKRNELASNGKAMPDGSFPIVNESDLKNAIKAIGRAQPTQRAAVRKHIRRRANAMGLSNLIPDEWSNQRTGHTLLDIGLAKALDTRAPLDRSPKKNWVENAGGLPMYIRRIANHLHAEKGMDISRAIATAVNAVKKMCATGDLNFPGRQNVNAGSHAEACAAVAEWEKKKASARVSKGIKGRKLTDKEYINFWIEKNMPPEVVISDEEFEQLAAEVDYPDDPDTAFTLEAEIAKTDGEKRLVFGWCSIGYDADGTLVDDRQGDVLDDVDEIEKSAYEFVLDSRDGGEMHYRTGVSTLVESFVSTPEKWEAMGIPPGTLPTGWWVGFKVTDDEVWKAVKEGKYSMFSVHGQGTRKALD